MRRAILHSGMAVGATRLAGAALGLAVTVLLGRQLGPAGLGTYGYALLVLSLLAVPVSNGWGTVLMRQVSGAAHTQRWSEARGLMLRGVQWAFVISVVAGTVGLALVVVLKGDLPASMNFWLLVPLIAVLFFDQMSALRQTVLRGLNMPVWGQVPEVVLRPALLMLGFWVALQLLDEPPGVQHAFWALAAASGLAALLGGVLLRARMPEGLRAAMPAFHSGEWMRSAVVLSGNSFLLILNASVDTLLLGVLGSLEQVGVYRVATQVALFSGFAYTALNMLATQRFAYLKAKGDAEALRSTAVFMARLALLGALPLPLIFWLFGTELIDRVFGVAFRPALGPMFLLFLGQVINAAVGMASAMLIMHGRESRVLRFTLAAVVLNAGLSWLLIPVWGVMGAAAANLFATSVWNIGIWIYLRNSQGIDSSVWGRHKFR